MKAKILITLLLFTSVVCADTFDRCLAIHDMCPQLPADLVDRAIRLHRSDINNDGVVDMRDFAIWADDYSVLKQGEYKCEYYVYYWH